MSDDMRFVFDGDRLDMRSEEYAAVINKVTQRLVEVVVHPCDLVPVAVDCQCYIAGANDYAEAHGGFYQRGLEEARQAVAAIHAPVPVYDECECDSDTREQMNHAIECDDYEGCAVFYRWDVCAQCCFENGYSTEQCWTQHNHGKDLPHCGTVAAIDALRTKS